jgi:diguanylate cyclase (GGDEF)-like protein/PAS domain S-box-containing protein
MTKMISSQDEEDMKRMDQANQISEDFFEAGLDLHFDIDVQGVIHKVNRAVEIMTGLDRNDMLGSRFSDWFTDAEAASDFHHAVCQRGLQPTDRLRLICSNGTSFAVSIRASSYKTATDEVKGVYVTARPVSASPDHPELIDWVGTMEASLQERDVELDKIRSLLKSSLDSQHNIVFLSIDTNYNYLYFNQAHAEAMKQAYGKTITSGMNILDQITNQDDVLKAKRNYDLALHGKSHSTIEEYGDLSKRYYETFYNAIRNSRNDIIGATAFAIDVTDRVEAQSRIRQQNNLFTSLLKLLPVGVFMVDAKDGKPLVANEAAQKILGRGILPDANEKNLSEIYETRKLGTDHAYPSDEMPIILGMKGIQSHIDDLQVERPDGSRGLLEIFGAPVNDETGKVMASLVTFLDITERRHFEDELKFLSFNDEMTGLYNRRFFEAELLRLDSARNLPLSIVMGDVNGLKLVNDTFGHASGDELLVKVSRALKAGARADDIIARYGGDEFIMILPRTSRMDAHRLVSRFKSLLDQEESKSVKISVSFGVGTKISAQTSINEIIKETEDDMYQHKIYESLSMRSKTIDLIMKTLFEKNSREVLHSRRVSEICVIIAKRMHLNNEEIKKIRITGLMHDIGKIGINEEILNSNSALDEEQLAEIKKHCEIGSRILGASGEFSEIAEVVLQHHERWDGKGYPRGLKGEAISLNARIVAIADTYDAMVSERAYRKAFSVEEAVAEIKRCAGTQFDPRVAKIFIDMSQDEIYSLYHNGVQTPRG